MAAVLFPTSAEPSRGALYLLRGLRRFHTALILLLLNCSGSKRAGSTPDWAIGCTPCLEEIGLKAEDPVETAAESMGSRTTQTSKVRSMELGGRIF